MIRILSRSSMKKITSSQPDEIAQKLKYLSRNPSDSRELLHTTLAKINIDSDIQNQQDQSLIATNTVQRKSNRLLGMLKVYAPLTAVVIVLAVGGMVAVRNRPAVQESPSMSSNSNTSSITANGTVENATAALNAEVSQEDTINQQILSEGQNSLQDIKAAAQQVGEVSNDASF